MFIGIVLCTSASHQELSAKMAISWLCALTAIVSISQLGWLMLTIVSMVLFLLYLASLVEMFMKGTQVVMEEMAIMLY